MLDERFLTHYYFTELLAYYDDLSHLRDIGTIKRDEAEKRFSRRIDELHRQLGVSPTVHDLEAWHKSYCKLHEQISERVRDANPEAPSERIDDIVGWIINWWQMARRDLRSASASSLHPDWQFFISFNAIRAVCALLARTIGFDFDLTKRPTSVFECMAAIEEPGMEQFSEYMYDCDYRVCALLHDQPGMIEKKQAEEIRRVAWDFYYNAEKWLLGEVGVLAPAVPDT